MIWAYAHLLTESGVYKNSPELTQHNCRTDRANPTSSAPWIKIPYPIEWGAPTFDVGHVFDMMAAVLVFLIESTEAYKAASRLASATPPPPHVLSRVQKFLWLLGSTRVGSRRVIQISAGFMIFFSMLGKFGVFFASIPFPIFAAMHCVLFGLVASVGLSFLQFTNMNSMRNLFITGVALFLGMSIPEYLREYTSKALHCPTHTKARWDLINNFTRLIHTGEHEDDEPYIKVAEAQMPPSASFIARMAPKRRRFEPTPATDHPSHSAPAPTDEPTPAMSHHVPPHPEARLSINDPANKSRKISQKYWTVDVRDARGVVKVVRLRSQDIFSLPPGQKSKRY
ncbi:DUF1279 super [Trifolium repens]|nr:DUF1279 super [Trifolium repens]